MSMTNGSKTDPGDMPNGNAVEMKDRILAAREKQGLTQHEVAQRAGLQISTYSRVESGERSERVSAAVVLRIARALGTTVEDLLGPDVPWAEGIKPQKATPVVEKRLDKMEGEIREIRKLLSRLKGTR